MAQVHGKIETLQSLKKELYTRGIREFSSVKEINDFLKRFREKRESVRLNAKITLEEELKKLREAEKVILNELEQSKNDTSFFRFFKRIRIQKNLKNQQKAILNITSDYDLHLLKRQDLASSHLEFIKATLEDLKPLIAGAIGERKVENELKKLPDHCHIFNNFVLYFDKTLYYKPKGEYIKSIQIDHLVLTSAGLFIVETKNWSDKTLDNPDIYSPVEQVKRCGFALYIALQNKKVRGLSLTKKIWGVPEIPIRNLIALINRKPKDTYPFVKIKNVHELNSYINYFEPVFSQEELSKIAFQLGRMNQGD